MIISYVLRSLASSLEDTENEALVEASKNEDSKKLEIVASALVEAANSLHKAADSLDEHAYDLDDLNVDFIASLASELDKSGDPELMKQASALDTILFAIAGGNADGVFNYKISQDAETDRLRAKMRDESSEKAYHSVNEELTGKLKLDDKKSESSNGRKLRPLESSLSTRYCPDHPSVSVLRIADGVYQCPLDKGVYNWEAGFKTMKGNQVPGTSVSNQTSFFGHGTNHANFSTREQRMGRK